MKQIRRGLLFLLSLVLASQPVFSDDTKESSDDATKIVNDIFGNDNESIPKWLLDKAQAVLVIPDFDDDNEQIQGIYSVRADNNNWSLPLIANVTTDGSTNDADAMVILFMKGKGSNNLRKGNSIVSGNGVKPGPSGNVSEDKFDQPDKDVAYVYTVKDNKATGAAVQQVAITSDIKGNKELYGKDLSIDKIIKNQVENPPEKAVQYQATLNNQSSAK